MQPAAAILGRIFSLSAASACSASAATCRLPTQHQSAAKIAACLDWNVAVDSGPSWFATDACMGGPACKIGINGHI